jgi:hypothetical protein
LTFFRRKQLSAAGCGVGNLAVGADEQRRVIAQHLAVIREPAFVRRTLGGVDRPLHPCRQRADEERAVRAECRVHETLVAPADDLSRLQLGDRLEFLDFLRAYPLRLMLVQPTPSATDCGNGDEQRQQEAVRAVSLRSGVRHVRPAASSFPVGCSQ